MERQPNQLQAIRPAMTPTVINGKKTRTYNAWSAMRRRCLNPKDPRYKWWGGRGITVCERWLGRRVGFRNFVEDMGECPAGL